MFSQHRLQHRCSTTDPYTHVPMFESKQVIGQLVRTTKQMMTRLQLKLLLTTKVIPILLYAQVVCYPTQRQGQLLLERVNRYVCRIYHK